MLVILVPLALLPIPLLLDSSPLGRCAFVALVMVVFWASEVVPLPITALLPMALFPPLGNALTCF